MQAEFMKGREGNMALEPCAWTAAGGQGKAAGRAAQAVNPAGRGTAKQRMVLRARKCIQFLELLAKERHSKIPVPARHWLSMWRRGFLREAIALYRFGEHGFADYVTDYARFVRTPFINENMNAVVLNNKFIFANHINSLFPGRPPASPANYGAMYNGTMVSLSDGVLLRDWDDVRALCAEKGDLVLKPSYGGGGAGIYVLSVRDGELRVNRKPAESAFPAMQRAVERSVPPYLIVEYVRQSEFSAGLFPDSVNTLRVLTMMDPDTREPFVARAIQRIGHSKTAPIDNFSQGGLSVHIDADTGRLGRGATHPYSGRVEWHEVHPETRTQITGATIPHWDAVKSGLLSIAAKLPYLPYVGWDLIHTDGGFRVIEGNNYTDVNLFQIHSPLLTDPRVRRFYQYHAVVK